MSTKPSLGAHVSAAGGLYKGVENGLAIGAECIQIFGASPRQWAAPLPRPEDVERFKKAFAASALKSTYLHAPYLNNLASTDVEMVAKTVKNMGAHLTIAEMIGAIGVIFHVGSGKEVAGASKEKSIMQAAEVMKQILKNVPGRAKLIIENSAGGGAKIGATPKEVGQLMGLVKSDRVATCYDTAHGFEAGLIDSYTPANITKLFNEYNKEVGLEHLLAFHANDSKTIFNSHHDRHENIGRGYVGKEAFTNLAKEKRIAHTHWFLEVPGYDGLGPDKANMDALKALVNNS